MNAADTLSVSSLVFAPDGTIPLCCTGFGEDVSPPLHLSGLCKGAVSLAVTMVDLDIPLLREYPHWLIWNLSPTQEIPAAIPPGESLPELHDAAQGVAYGVHRYRGPKPPLWVRNTHRYRFDVYVLDCRLALDSQARLRDLRRAMKGHILQRGSLIGKYRHSQPFGSRTLTGERSI